MAHMSTETMSSRRVLGDYDDSGRNGKWTACVEIFENALGRRSTNLVSGNGRAVAGGMARGNVDSSPHRPAERTRSLSGIRNHNLYLAVRGALSSAKIGSWNPSYLMGCLCKLARPFFAAQAWLFLVLP